MFLIQWTFAEMNGGSVYFVAIVIAMEEQSA
jgi:hypothetical protein